ncbi:glutaminase A [Neomicrococcus aestuarii]|uniref:Glutaminase n=1 Tax=Neomicrococcus aestuarii TaxID=556325 RepID=A0A1L2ZPD6_9MICC|nr:glutaminase A [Neomicrococcus aestuarii]APF41285.1 glutaminase A [Neomicrococcus aestuarii]
MKSPIQQYLDALHEELHGLTDGTPYQGIPSTAVADPSKFGICLATVDGVLYEAGDTDELFSIQSISKPFTYALALEDLGSEAVGQKIDVEPSGDAFNEISLQSGTGRPDNPMINAGAIAATSLVKSRGPRSRFGRIQDFYSSFAGRDLDMSSSVFSGERDTGYRNRALAQLLRSFGIIEENPDPVVEDYFRQCSIMVNARDLALMAATLANGGIHPSENHRVVSPETVQQVLSVMTTCGMYDDAGAWTTSVGLPAKSGVGGGIIAVLPGQVGIAVYSPPLDPHGSSVRGVAACTRLASDMGLHFMRSGRPGRSSIRSLYTLRDSYSGVRRSADAIKVLEAHAEQCVIIELGGDLLFAGTETVLRTITEMHDRMSIVVLDVRKVDDFGPVALRMMTNLVNGFAAEGKSICLVDPDGAITEQLDKSCRKSIPSFPGHPVAMEWAEGEVIGRYAPELITPDSVDVRSSATLEPLKSADLDVVSALLEDRSYESGHVIRRIGQPFAGIQFIVSGRVSLTGRTTDGSRYRQATLGPGMTFGEIALGASGQQQTTVTALEPTEVKVLTHHALDDLEESHPQVALRLWKAIARDAYTRVEQTMKDNSLRLRG